MKIKTLIAAAILSLAGTAVVAQDLFVAAGREGWGYDRRATALVEQLRGEWDVKNLSGSEDIAREVCAGTAQMGIAQVDAIYQMSTEGCNLLPLGIYPAQEYAFIMFPPDGVSELHDLNSSNRILVGEVGSGAALFWRTIVSIENGEHGNGSSWSQAEAVYGPFALADTQASLGNIDAVIMVTSPDADIIQQLLTAGWEVGELDDKDINDFQFNRGNLYERSTIRIDHPTRFRDIRQDAIEVRSYWIGNAEFLAADQGFMSRAASLIATIQ